MTLTELAKKFHVFVKSETGVFQRKARIMQSLWREEMGLPLGKHGDKLLGSRLPTNFATTTLANYLTDTIRAIVTQELEHPDQPGKLYAKPRIYNDLLSSQPLCFNLFGELTKDLPLLSSVIRKLTNGRFHEVTSIRFEHSPGRSDTRFTGDRSAFDVFLECQTSAGEKGFLGIEVKYHENLRTSKEDLKVAQKERLQAIGMSMNCFVDVTNPALFTPPLHQIWRDNLLMGSLLQAGNYQDGAFVFLYPQGNTFCQKAVIAYQRLLSTEDYFYPWTIQAFVEELKRNTDHSWIETFQSRYLHFEKLNPLLD